MAIFASPDRGLPDVVELESPFLSEPGRVWVVVGMAEDGIGELVAADVVVGSGCVVVGATRSAVRPSAGAELRDVGNCCATDTAPVTPGFWIRVRVHSASSSLAVWQA